jgi:hypothetical protein
MSRNDRNPMLKHLIEKAEAYNHSMFSNNKSSSDNVTQQILFCQNGINNLNISSEVNHENIFIN